MLGLNHHQTNGKPLKYTWIGTDIYLCKTGGFILAKSFALYYNCRKLHYIDNNMWRKEKKLAKIS